MFHGALLHTVGNMTELFFYRSFLWKSYDFLNVYSSLISTTYLQTFTFFNLIWQICSCSCSSVIRTCSNVYDNARNSFGSPERNRRINILKEFFMLNLLPSDLRMFALNFFRNHWSFEKLLVIKKGLKERFIPYPSSSNLLLGWIKHSSFLMFDL